jgi:hydrogenase maturation protease
LKPLILCLGNEIVSDDRFGAEIEALLQPIPSISEKADVIFAAVAGFALLDFLAGRSNVLIVDTIRMGAEPGTLHQFTADRFVPSKNLTTSHQINLPTALELGKKLGIDMPEVVDILAVEALDLETLCEELTPPVKSALEPAIKLIEKWVREHQEETENVR